MRTTRVRLAGGLVTGGLLLGGLAACSGSNNGLGGSVSAGTSGNQAGVAASASASASAGSASASGSAGSVTCAGASCSVTLDSGHTKATVLGTTVTLGGVSDGKASLGVAGHDVSCTQGDKVSAGPLSVTCSKVTQDAVTLTAKLG